MSILKNEESDYDLVKVKEALASLFFKKSSEKENGLLFYLLAKELNNHQIKYLPDANLILSTDGENIYYGQLYNTYMASLKPNQRRQMQIAFLTHEILHILNAHTSRSLLAKDKILYNILADLYVNTEIKYKLKIEIPNSFVTADSFANFITTHFGNKISNEQAKQLNRIADGILSGSLSLEQAYNILSLLSDDIKEEIKNNFGSGKFFGHDLKNDEGEENKENEGKSGDKDNRRANDLESGGNDKNKKEENEKKNKEEKSGGKSGNECKAEDYRKIYNKLDDIAKKISKTLEEVERGVGEYKQLFRISAGNEYGKIYSSDYKELQKLRANIFRIFTSEVSSFIKDSRVSFSSHDDDAYWLPLIEDIYNDKYLAFIDASPSIPDSNYILFASFIKSVIDEFKVEFDASIFGTGEINFANIKNAKDVIDAIKYRGMGTVFDSTIAKRIKYAENKGIKLIVILSDFKIIINDDVYRAIREYKRKGGKIACFSTTNKFETFCDYKHEMPTISDGVGR